MNRIPKICFIFVLGAVIFAIGTALAGNSMRPLSLHDAETLSGGVLCYDDDGTCDPTDWCDGNTCPTSPSQCTSYKYVDKIFTDQECAVLSGYEDWECGVHNFEECAESYDCVIDDNECVKGSYDTSKEGARSCHSRPI